MKNFLLLIILFPLTLKANFFKNDHLSGALGFQGNSILHKRGIITYDGHQLFPIYSINLFNPNLLIAGSAIYYRHQFLENFFIRSRFNFDSTGDDPLYETEEKENERVRRETTSEFDLYFEYVTQNQSFLRFQISQDLSAHNGQYFELRGRFALFDFLKRDKELPLIQPALFSSIGSGTREHNQYFYGNSASSGINNFEFGLSIGSPQVIDVFWPTFKVTYFQISGQRNRNAEFVQEKDGVAIEMLMAFKIF